ncbi:MAG: family 78 glycoside hydrolase catalytic domain, partial [Clostridia bacterium]|nr:family 78 glycoside hydrolase catalytic domain [Clostridia bacterium]
HIPKVIAEIHCTYEDGSVEVIATDSSWRCEKGPVTFNGIRNGEFYDARLEIDGWSEADYNDSMWSPVKTTRPPGGIMKAMEMEPERIVDSWEPGSSWKTPENNWVFASDVNMAGFSEITVSGQKDTEITIKYSERLLDDCIHIDTRINAGFVKSGEFQTDRYIKKSNGPETWRPRFVYHGFQYLEISGCNDKPGVILHMVNSDIRDAGGFECSDGTLNKIHEAAMRATLSNLHSVPTDDPHREKNAWTGDVSLSAEQMLFNFRSVPLLRKWLGDIRDSQRPDGAIPCVVPSTGWGYNWGNGPDWSSALTMIPWYIYVMTADVSILSENYESIKRHLSYIKGQAEDNIVNYGIGDWCPPFEGPAKSVTMSSFKTPTEVTDTAYYYATAVTVSKISKVLGFESDACSFSKLSEGIKESFRNRYYDGKHGVTGDCQTSTACMIYQGLAAENERHLLLRNLWNQIEEMDFHQDTGILGNKYLYNTLGEYGYMETALKMILNDTYPSFKDWINNGATTLWECWNGEGSRNHHMFSDVSAVFYKYLAGIKPDENHPGFRSIIIQPDLNCGLSYVKAWHDSPFGRVFSAWKLEGEFVEIKIKVPCGCKALLKLPGNFNNADYPGELPAGEHEFRVRILDRIGELRKYYDKYADNRELTVKDNWKIQLRKKVADAFMKAGVASVLEIGCGTGQDSRFFMDNGFIVKAIDLSRKHVEYCHAKGIDARVMDMHNMQFDEGEFDAVYAMNCLLHVPFDEMPEVLSGIKKVLKTNGIVFIGNYAGNTEGRRRFSNQDVGRFFSFREFNEYKSLLSASGFEILDSETIENETPFKFNSFIMRKK